MIHLVRHGRSLVDPDAPPHTWPLDPAGHADVHALRTSGRLPRVATWFSSPEVKARETADLLTDAPVTVVGDLAEHRRGVHWFESGEEFVAAVRSAVERPDDRVVLEWEPVSVTRERVVRAVRALRAAHRGDLVLVGHGTAWTVLVAALTGTAPDLAAWERLAMPDLWVVDDAPE